MHNVVDVSYLALRVAGNTVISRGICVLVVARLVDYLLTYLFASSHLKLFFLEERFRTNRL